MTSLEQPGLLREQAYIAGAWRGADDGAVLDVTNPSTGELIARVPNMGAAETRAAIAAAHSAFASWRKTTAKERARLLRTWFELIMARQEDLAVLMTREQGKLARLTVTKQKEFERGEGLHLELVEVPGTGSAVLRLADPAKVKAVQEGSDEKVMAVLRIAGDKGLSMREIAERAESNPNTVKTALQRLKRAGSAKLEQRHWYALPEPKVSPEWEAELAV